MTKPATHPTPKRANHIATLRIELRGTEPLIWRQLEVPTAITLEALHEIVQAAMGWSNTHLWEFTVGGRHYGPPDDDDWRDSPLLDAAEAMVGEVLGQRETTIDYLYDFGDNWELRLTLSNLRAAAAGTSYPRYVGGERNAPPEDCGGVHGFYNLLDILADPANPDHADMRDWAGDYDPDTIDEATIRSQLADVAR